MVLASTSNAQLRILASPSLQNKREHPIFSKALLRLKWPRCLSADLVHTSRSVNEISDKIREPMDVGGVRMRSKDGGRPFVTLSSELLKGGDVMSVNIRQTGDDNLFK